MKKTYQIEVDCANCANLMEEATKKTEGVADAVVNFMTQKMIVEFEDGQDAKAVMKNVLKACKKVEPDCEIELLITSVYPYSQKKRPAPRSRYSRSFSHGNVSSNCYIKLQDVSS